MAWNSLRGRLIDTMVAHYLLDPDQRHNLDIMAQSILKYKTITFSELVGDKKIIKFHYAMCR